MRTRKIEIGAELDIHTWPIEIQLLGTSYILTKDADTYSLLSTNCPHVGGKVHIEHDCIACPIHGWKFSRTTGESINVPRQRLVSYEVYVDNGKLYAEVPDLVGEHEKENKWTLQKNYTIKLHSHACLEFAYEDFSLLTDPWIEGPAFFGSWVQYPAPVVEAKKLQPSAIWVSHEHSDHLHIGTMEHFDRSIPIYFPDFPNQRIQKMLYNIGFKNLHPMPFGQTIEISADFKITCFEPASLWNDALLLIEIPGFRFLNLNDAGLNHRIASLIGPVDAISTGFSPGASGYPLTWTHLDNEQKTQIMESSKAGMLKMMEQAVTLHGAKLLFPFASHFLLWHPQHRQYVKQLRKNTLDDVVAFFQNSSTQAQVVDLLPGDYWHANSRTLTRYSRNRSELYRANHIQKYLDQLFDETVFSHNHPSSSEISIAEIERYFLKFNQTSEIANCENLIFSIKATDLNDFEHVYTESVFAVHDRRLTVIDVPSQKVNLLIEIPATILKNIIEDNVSWDEAHIGYWCRFSRDPDIYHAGFWRMLQAPYFRRKIETPAYADGDTVTVNTVIADVLEKYGSDADQILRRYGMYCFGCHHSTVDTLFTGARGHSISSHNLDRMVLELNRL